jgi:glyoxylase-like metal-dependent hydrolase (beta-lactamase superfamily II)
VSYYSADSGVAFVGDTAGIRRTEDGYVMPPTPPPDIDLEAWHRSIELVSEWSPERLAMTHFGAADDVDAQLAELSERLDRWAALARAGDRAAFTAGIRAEIGSVAAAEYEQAAPAEQLYAGLERYWRKRSEDRAPE